MYVPVVTSSAENDNKLLEQLKTGYKRTIKWNKYRSESKVKVNLKVRSESIDQTKSKNLNYLIDLTFTNLNSLFVFIICK